MTENHLIQAGKTLTEARLATADLGQPLTAKRT